MIEQPCSRPYNSNRSRASRPHAIILRPPTSQILSSLSSGYSMISVIIAASTDFSCSFHDTHRRTEPFKRRARTSFGRYRCALSRSNARAICGLARGHIPDRCSIGTVQTVNNIRPSRPAGYLTEAPCRQPSQRANSSAARHQEDRQGHRPVEASATTGGC